jgi:hypothetical protein
MIRKDMGIYSIESGGDGNFAAVVIADGEKALKRR